MQCISLHIQYNRISHNADFGDKKNQCISKTVYTNSFLGAFFGPRNNLHKPKTHKWKLRTNEGFTLSNKGKFAWTKYLGTLLKLCTNGKRTNKNRMNQGLGVLQRHQTCMELTCQRNKKEKESSSEWNVNDIYLGRRNILLQMQKNLWQRSRWLCTAAGASPRQGFAGDKKEGGKAEASKHYTI